MKSKLCTVVRDRPIICTALSGWMVSQKWSVRISSEEKTLPTQKWYLFLISMIYCFILKLNNFPSPFKGEFSIQKLSSLVLLIRLCRGLSLFVQERTYFFGYKCSDQGVGGWFSTNPNIVLICKSVWIIGRSLTLLCEYQIIINVVCSFRIYTIAFYPHCLSSDCANYTQDYLLLIAIYTLWSDVQCLTCGIDVI